MQWLLIDIELKEHVHTIYFHRERERYYNNKLNYASIFIGYYPSSHDLLKYTPRYIDDVLNVKKTMARPLKETHHAIPYMVLVTFLCFSLIKKLICKLTGSDLSQLLMNLQKYLFHIVQYIK